MSGYFVPSILGPLVVLIFPGITLRVTLLYVEKEFFTILSENVKNPNRLSIYFDIF
jgi:hypothetical protein